MSFGAEISISPATLDFGSVELGEVSAAGAFTVSNSGGQACTLRAHRHRRSSRDSVVEGGWLREPGIPHEGRFAAVMRALAAA